MVASGISNAQVPSVTRRYPAKGGDNLASRSRGNGAIFFCNPGGRAPFLRNCFSSPGGKSPRFAIPCGRPLAPPKYSRITGTSWLGKCGWEEVCSDAFRWPFPLPGCFDTASTGANRRQIKARRFTPSLDYRIANRVHSCRAPDGTEIRLASLVRPAPCGSIVRRAFWSTGNDY